MMIKINEWYILTEKISAVRLPKGKPHNLQIYFTGDTDPLELQVEQAVIHQLLDLLKDQFRPLVTLS